MWRSRTNRLAEVRIGDFLKSARAATIARVNRGNTNGFRSQRKKCCRARGNAPKKSPLARRQRGPSPPCDLCPLRVHKRRGGANDLFRAVGAVAGIAEA